MKVKDLIEQLMQCDPESRVYVRLLLGRSEAQPGAPAREKNRIASIDGAVQEAPDPYSPVPGPVCIEATAIERRTRPRRPTS
jgi:hypothetical protein